MNKKIKIFLAYFPIILVCFQVSVNFLYFISYSTYVSWGLILNTFVGTNVLFAVFLVLLTHTFKFCAVSKFAAYAQLLFGVAFLIIREDNIYNVLVQIIVGIGALLFTFRYFVRRFPLCKLSLLVSFISSIFSTGSCEKGLNKWDRITYHKIAKSNEHNSS